MNELDDLLLDVDAASTAERHTEEAEQVLTDGQRALANINYAADTNPEAMGAAISASRKNGRTVTENYDADNQEANKPDVNAMAPATQRFFGEGVENASVAKGEEDRIDDIVRTAEYASMPLADRRRAMVDEVKKLGYTWSQISDLRAAGYHADILDDGPVDINDPNKRYKNVRVYKEDRANGRIVPYNGLVMEKWYCSPEEVEFTQQEIEAKSKALQEASERAQNNRFVNVRGSAAMLTLLPEDQAAYIQQLDKEIAVMQALNLLHPDWNGADDKSLKRMVGEAGKLLGLDVSDIPVERLRPAGVTMSEVDWADAVNYLGVQDAYEHRTHLRKDELNEVHQNPLAFNDMDRMDLVDELESQAKALRGTTFGNKAWTGAIVMERFMVELAAAGVFEPIEAAMSEGVSGIMTKMAAKEMTKRAALWELTKGYFRNLFPHMVKEEAAGLVPNTVAATYSRLVPGGFATLLGSAGRKGLWKYSGKILSDLTEETGEIYRFVEDNQVLPGYTEDQTKDLASKFFNLVLDNYIEIASEGMGGLLPGVSGLGKFIPERVKSAAFVRIMKSVADRKTVKAIGNFGKRAGLSGIGGEEMEELVGDAARWVATQAAHAFGSDFGDLGQEEPYVGWEAEKERIVLLALPMAAFHTGAYVVGAGVRAMNAVRFRSGQRVIDERIRAATATLKRSPETMEFLLRSFTGMADRAFLSPDKARVLFQSMPDAMTKLGITENVIGEAESKGRMIPVSMARTHTQMSAEEFNKLLDDLIPDPNAMVTTREAKKLLPEDPSKVADKAMQARNEFSAAIDEKVKQLKDAGRSDTEIRAFMRLLGPLTTYMGNHNLAGKTPVDILNALTIKSISEPEFLKQFVADKPSLYQGVIGIPGFYSNMMQSLADAPQAKMTPAQWLAYLQKSGGLKAGETTWRGSVEKFFEGRDPNVAVDKQELIDAFENGMVDILEMSSENPAEAFGEDASFLYSSSAVDRAAARLTRERDQLVGEFRGKPLEGEEKESFGKRIFAINDALDGIRELKRLLYHDPYNFVLHGLLTPAQAGENIRAMYDYLERDSNLQNFLDEYARVAPLGRKWGHGEISGMEFNKEKQALEAHRDTLNKLLRTNWNPNARSAPARTIEESGIRNEYTTDGLDYNREIVIYAPEVAPFEADDDIHFGTDTNGTALVWVRFGETRDEDGNHVLVIDEIQSNRHQAGRERGYSEQKNKDKGEVQPRMVVLDNIYEDGPMTDDDGEETFRLSYELTVSTVQGDDVKVFVDRNGDVVASDDYSGGSLEDLLGKDAAETVMNDLIWTEAIGGTVNFEDDGVPPAPFEKNWHELGMKRMIRYAAEHGYDKIAWTSGQQQAKRYNIGSHISRIRLNKRHEDGSMEMEALGVRSFGFTTDASGNVTESSLAGAEGRTVYELFGKELGQKIMELTDASHRDEKSLRVDSFRIDGYESLGTDIEVSGEKPFRITVDSDGNINSFAAPSQELWGFKPDGDTVFQVFGHEVGSQIVNLVNRGNRGDEVHLDEEWHADFVGKDNVLRLDKEAVLGGEGMKTFYDKILKNFTEKYIKKWGSKVGVVTLPDVEEDGREMWGFDVTDRMKADVMGRGQPLFQGENPTAESEDISPEQEQEIRAAYEYAMNGEPVARLTGEEFQKDDVPLTEKVTRLYKEKYGGKATHPELGDIKLDLEGVKASLAHGIGRVKAAAYAAVPQLIEKGKIVDRQTNWKGRGYDTVVMVAPLEIGGVPYVGEVVVEKRSNRQGFYLHEVEIKEKLADAFKTPTEGSASPVSRLIIAHLIGKVKQQNEKRLSESVSAAAKQEIGSGETSLDQVAAGFKKIDFKPGTVNLDLGGGKFDRATEYLAEKGVTNLVYDPVNRSAESNQAIFDAVKKGGVDTVTCNNVLNVIKEEGARSNVILQAAKALKPDGVAYFTVYEGDGSGNGHETSKGWQEHRKTADYMDEIKQHFGDVVRHGKIIEARNPQTEGKVSAWFNAGFETPPALFQSKPSGNRGAITFNEDWKATIALFEGAADGSTVIHETGHYIFDMMQHFVEAGLADDRMKSDYEKLRAWATISPEQAAKGYEAYLKGVPEGELPLTMEQWKEIEEQERLARGFEAYCMEGRAPSVELQGAFATLRRILLHIYKTVRALGVTLSDDVRKVFDGMLATETTLVRDSILLEAADQIDRELLGLSQAEVKTFRELIQKSNEQAVEAMTAEKNAKLKELRKQWRKEAQELMDGDPVYNVWFAVQKEGRMDYVALEEIAGEYIAQRLRAMGLATNPGRKSKEKLDKDGKVVRPAGYYSAKSGKHPATMAAQAGFDSVEEMIDALLASKSPQDFTAEYMADEERKFNAEFEMSETAQSVQASIEALEKLSEMLAVKGGQIGYRFRRALLKRQAMDELNRMSVSHIVSDKKLIADCRMNARALTKAANEGDFKTAFEHSKALRFNLEVLRLKGDAKKVVADAESLLKKGRHAKKGTIYGDHQDALIDLSVRFGFTRTLPKTPLQHTVASVVAEFNAEAMENDDLPLDVPEWMLTGSMDYQKMQFGQFQELANLAEFLYGEGKELVSAREETFRNTVKQAVEGTVNELKDQKHKYTANPNSIVHGWRSMVNWGTKLRNIVGMAVDWNPDATLQKLYDEMAYAESEQTQIMADPMRQCTEALDALYKATRGLDFTSISDIPFPQGVKARNYKKWDAEKLVAACLNMGTAKNKQRLIDGYEWAENGEDYVNRLASMLTAEDWANIQKIWDAIGTLTSRTSQTFKEEYHYDLKLEDAVPFTVKTKDGQEIEVAGGYYPLEYLYHKNSVVNDRAEALKNAPKFRRASFTFTRNEGVTDPVSLSLNLVFSHIFDASHYISHRGVMRKVLRVINDSTFRDHFQQTQGFERYAALKALVENVAAPGAALKGMTSGLENWGRSMVTASALWASPSVVAMQLSSITYGLDELGGYYLEAAAENMAHPVDTFKFVMGHSGMMRDRVNLKDLDLKMRTNRFSQNTVVQIRETVKQFGYSPMRFVDLAVAIPAWKAAYDRALDAGKSDSQAVAAADEFVAKTQGATRAIDLSPLQLKAWGRGLTVFFSAVSAGSTMATRTVSRIFGGHLSPLEAAYSATMNIILPLFLSCLIRFAVSGAGAGDDPDKARRAFLRELITNPFQGVPVVRDVADFAAARILNKGKAQRTVIENTSLRSLSDLAVTAFDGIDAAFEDNPDRACYKLADAVGTLLEVPVVRVYERLRQMLVDWTGDEDIMPDIDEETKQKKSNKKRRRH